ncbi:hypothetical protein SCOR_19125 [Sulfidibacter corallicola]|uniref:Glucosamine-6-phosphate deaminase n=1 Tax=Sulfidibacter corallicola TaxID=2818388 RepID=A0A8A4TU02_SULCO|nr:hypothetical protein [Sulfidibacter corallicola]QTD53439.1 hypothetical protein J3U87_13375 [Sulfidibacter corallicola]
MSNPHLDRPDLSAVERTLMERGGQADRYAPREKIRTLVVEHFPMLGKVTALRFLEWAQRNPDWSVALPTGKTPEHFIKWTQRILRDWDRAEVRRILETHGLDPARKPDLSRLHFIQIDDFYPIHGWQQNSFFHYVNRFYLGGFGFDPKKALLIDPDKIGLDPGEDLDQVWPEGQVDLSLRTRAPRTALQRRQQRLLAEVDEFCYRYEERIRELGGVGFFLGGIGPDGHIGFNVRGSDHLSTTRLCETNYETQAAAASDLGGIEISSARLVITIGLGTITWCPETTALVIAAGEAKAAIVQRAIESEPSNQVPASVLHKLDNACFYVTKGAARLLTERRHHQLETPETWDDTTQRSLVIDAALNAGCSLAQTGHEQIERLRSGSLLLERLERPVVEACDGAASFLKESLNRALATPCGETFLHTAPHHDDIMLGYLPYLAQFVQDPANSHRFQYLTSGFNAVTNGFMVDRCNWASALLRNPEWRAGAQAYLAPDRREHREAEVQMFLDALGAEDATGAARSAVGARLLACVAEIYGEPDPEALEHRIDALRHYFLTTYPGKKDEPEVQKLKGMLREWEAEVLWGHLGFGLDTIHHARLGFYKGDIFTEEPEINRDVLPVLEEIRRVQPSVVTVAFDPEGSGPDTHYKVMQAVAAALRLYRDETGRNDIRIWGYRNVWYRFHPAEADLVVPVSLGQMAELHRLFLDSFASQREASFPSYEHQGPFSELARQIQVEQYRQIRTLLGESFLRRHPDPRVRAARGFLFVRVMELDEFFEKTRELKKSIE